MDNNKIKAVIFDVDGVIFKTYDDNRNYLWSRTIKEDLGITSKHFSIIFSEKWDDIIKGKLDFIKHLEFVFQEKLFQNLGIKPKQYIEYWLAKDYQIDQNVLNLVMSLKIPCYMGTNQEAMRSSHILNAVGSFFKGCFTSYKIGFIKPEKEFFQYIQRTLSLTPSELLLIDDTKNNIEGGKECGWHVYHYQNNLDNLTNFLKNHELLINN